MTKRILALSLCIVMLCGSLFGCAKKNSNDMGAYITMYLTDEIYDFDPASAYYNSDTVNVLSMMYDTLFKLDENGKVKKSLVDSYEIVEKDETKEYYIEFTLNEAYWSTKDQLTAEHVVYAWKRLVDFRNNFEAASLLYDIKNARAIKEGDLPVDDLGVEAVENTVVKVSFESPIDYDQFILNLTSVATAPLLDLFVSSNPDWAKKASTIATSGPFKLGKIHYIDTDETAFDDNAIGKDGVATTTNKQPVKKISYFYLERNSYYYRDTKHDAYDKSVKPYRLLVDCSKTDAQILEDFKNGKLFYIGNIPLSLRTGDNAEYILDNAKISDALSTFSIELNQNALIDDGGRGTFLFANSKVREALSVAIDREEIAKAVVFAEAADAFVANGIFEEGTKGEFRTSKLASSLIETNANIEKAKGILTEAGIDASKYSFSIKVASYDEVHMTMTEMIKDAWVALGFNVEVTPLSPIENNDYFDDTGSVPPDVCDDLFIEAVQGSKFEAIALDVTAFSADAYSMLSNYAYAFSGFFYADADNDDYRYDTHVTGYNSVSYNILMEAIYYIPYFASIDTMNNSNYLVSHLNTKPYEESAIATMKNLTIAISPVKEYLTALNTVINPADEAATIDVNKVSEAFSPLLDNILALETASKVANKDIVAAKISDDAANAVNDATESVVTTVTSSLSSIETASKDIKDAVSKSKDVKATSAQKAEALTKALTSARVALTDAQTILTKTEDVLTAVTAAKDGTSKQTLKDAIREIYVANGINVTDKNTKKNSWTSQKSVLLHKAEELLMEDLPVIPVVYNQNAILVHKDLSRVDATYYAPAYFRKTKLKKYTDYIYYSEEDEKDVSIFKNFPDINWDKVGK